MNNPRLVQCSSTDGIALPALLFEPTTQTKSVAIYVHGNGSVSAFYSVDDTNTMAAALADVGVAYFALNNRGAHIVHSLNRTLPDGTVERQQYGTAFELIKNCVQDIDGAIGYLKTLGYTEFFLIGESTGANKICVYNHYRPHNDIAKYVLVSPGDDSGYFYQEMGAELFALTILDAKARVAADKGRDIAPSPIAEHTGYMSYQSVLDTLDPNGDYNTFPYNDALNKLGLSQKPLFEYFSEITTPSLVVLGGQDEYCYGKVTEIVSLLKARVHPMATTTFKVINGGNHAMSGKYQELAAAVSNFVKK